MITFCAPEVDVDRAERLTREIVGAITTRRIYVPEHRRTVTALHNLHATLQAFLSEPGVGRFLLTVSGGVIAHEGIPMSNRGGLDLLIKLLADRKCGGLVLRPELRLKSVHVLIEWLAGRQPQPSRAEIAGIDILPEGSGDNSDDDPDPILQMMPEFRVAHKLHRRAHSVLEDFMENMRAEGRADLDEVLDLTRWTAKEAFHQGAALLAPTQTRNHDSYTFNHSINVFFIATTLLQPFARDEEELARFAQAALLHDVGKSRIPREVLFKAGGLTADEFELIKRHPICGAEILQQCRHLDPLAIEVAYCHHMRDEGHGYPRPNLPVHPGPVTAMVQVADMFEALTAHRPYRRGLSAREALERILATPGMKSKLPAIAILLNRLTRSPPGSQVRLASGVRGLVVRTSPQHPDRPLIRVFADGDGTAMAEPYLLDLSEVAEDDDHVAAVMLKPSLIRPRSETPIVVVSK